MGINMLLITALMFAIISGSVTTGKENQVQQPLNYDQYFTKIIQLYFNYQNVDALDDGIIKKIAKSVVEEEVKEYVRRYPQYSDRFIRGELPGLNGGNASEMESLLRGLVADKIDSEAMDSYKKAGQWLGRIKRRM